MFTRLLVLTITLVLFSTQAAAKGTCSASATLVQRPGAWTEGGESKSIWDMHITNTASCSFSGTVGVQVNVPGGSFLGNSWGYNAATHQVTGVPDLSPGQSFSGIGFILSGNGEPTATVTSCTCDSTGSSSEAPGNNLPTLPPTTPFDRTLRALILTCGTASEVGTLQVAELIFNSMGTPADVISQATLGTAALTLTNPDGTGLYYVIVSANMLTTCWSSDQQTQIANYEIAFAVKMVILYAYPSAANGVTLVNGTTLEGNLTFAPGMYPYARALRTDAVIDLYDSFVYPSTITDSSIATPAFYVTYPASVNNTQFHVGTQYVAAAFITPGDGRRHLEFYFATGTWALYASIAGTAWLNWGTNGVFAGARRIEFNCHTDDVFMETGMWDTVANNESQTNNYRMTVEDFQFMITWQDGMNSRLPAGSNVRLTFPFNGATVIQYGGYDTDPLFLFAHNPANRQKFFWESHTWSHPILDDLTYDECYVQFAQNNLTALQLFDNDLTNEVYNEIAVITPSISGLFNGECLRAMYDLGIRYICGDNTHPEQLPPNDYWGWYTNVTSNGFDGMFVVPRWATDIYFDASEPIEIYEQYNWLYKANLTFDEIITISIATNTRYLLSYRHDPYMFHQANMRNIIIDGQNTTLISYWIDAVLNGTLSYSTLPITSHRHEDIAQMLLDRMARDACGVTATLRMNQAQNTIIGIHAVSTGTCLYAFSGVQAAENEYITFEQVGDETTVWVQLTPNNPVDIIFTTPISIL